MSISPSKARALCTESEYNLVKWSSPKNVKALTPAKLKDKVDRARKLRDKFRDLAKQQRGEERGKRKPTGKRAAKGNERTVQKAELFDQTLTRFQKALEKAEKETAKPANSSKTKTTRKTSRQTVSPSEAPRPKSKKSKRSKSESTRSSGSADTSNQGSTKGTTKKPSAKPQAKSSKTTSTAAAPKAPIPLAAPAHRSFGSTLSLGAGSSTSGLTGLFSSSIASQQSRETRRRDKAASTKIGREQSRFAATAREKIQGHVSSQTRRSQAKRDSKGG